MSQENNYSEKIVFNNIWDHREHILVMPKNRIHDTMISHCIHKDREYADIRIYDNGIPTRHGVSIKYEDIDTVIEALLNIKERVEDCEQGD